MEIKVINETKKNKVRKILKDKTGIVEEEEDLVSIYENLLSIIWNRLLPTLGKFTVTTIVKRSITISENKFPIISNIEIKDEFSLEKLRNQLKEEDCSYVSDAFNELIVNIIEILASLTGEIIIQKLLEEMEK